MARPLQWPAPMPRWWSLACLLTCCACVTSEPPPSPGAREDVRRVVAALDDLAADYAAAIAANADHDDGPDAVRLAVLDHLMKDARLFGRRFAPREVAALDAVRAALSARAPADDVVPAARALRAKLLADHQLVLAPAAPPARPRAVQLYQAACWGCHGTTGAGDGPQGLELEPGPKDFHEPDYMAALSPARTFSRIADGMPGTAMPSWGMFTTAERWGLASYLFEHRHDAGAVARGRALAAARGIHPTFSAIADRPDGELVAELERAGLSPDAALDVLAYLRVEVAYALPGGPLAAARAALARGVDAHAARQWRDARAAFAALRREVAPVVALLRGHDAVAAARLEQRAARLDDLARASGLHDEIAHEAAHVARWLDRAEPVVRSPDVATTLGLAARGALAAAIALGLALGASSARSDLRLGGAGLALGALAGAAAPPATPVAAGVAIGVVAAAIVALTVTRAGAAAAVLGLTAAAVGRLALAWSGAAAALAIAVMLVSLAAIVAAVTWLARNVATARGLTAPSLAVAIAGVAGAAVWSVADARAVASPLPWRVEVLGLFPSPHAIAAAVVGAALVVVVTLVRPMHRGAP